jgi:hypothetical protein
MINRMAKLALVTAICAVSANSYADQAGATVGNFQFALQQTEYDYWGSSYTPWKGFSLGGSISNPVGDSNAVQVDFKGFNLADKDDDGYYAVHALSGAAHYIWKRGSYDVGAFGGVLMTNGYYGSGTDMNLFLGGEGRTDLTDSISLHGQLGFLENQKSYYEYTGSVYFGQAVVSGFVGNNLLLEASLGFIYGGVGDDSGEDAETHTWGVRAEYGFLKSLSGFIAVSGHQDNDHWRDSDFDTMSVALGVNYGFGADSLKARHQAAPAMKPMNFDAISWLRVDGY